MKLNYTGKTALVAGAGGGMGLTIANRLIESGINVSMADIKDLPSGISGGPGKHLYTQCDLTSEQDIACLLYTSPSPRD